MWAASSAGLPGRACGFAIATIPPFRAALIAAVWVALLPAMAFADGLEDLISPGALSDIHARETKACADCHERFDRGSQGRLCLACHEDVAADLEQARGLHGRIGDVGRNECRLCHTEHQGADADILGLDTSTFDHRRTGLALEGAHGAVPCGGCHRKGQAYREVAKTCIGCHREDDAHRGELGEDCRSCHGPVSWRDATFDHSTTRFPLEGRHVDTDCSSCHPLLRFAETPVQCVSCHAVDDVHGGKLGPDCAKCHDASGFRGAGFDHARETRFALEGAHTEVDCSACHRADPKQEKLSMECGSCHRQDDVHAGTRGSDCRRCHGVDAWRPARFDHARDAKLALHGAHVGLDCALCHVGRMTAEHDAPRRCVECHRLVDAHDGTLGSDCASCHVESKWTVRRRFDHDLTAFPLLALHQLATCEDCHRSAHYREADSRCVACHAESDVHERRLGAACESCHNPNGWDRWLFDHAKQTNFVLSGAHRGLDCVLCHVKPAPDATSLHALEISSRCDSCHIQDSPHDDAFGRDCERCHVDSSWKKIERRSR